MRVTKSLIYKTITELAEELSAKGYEVSFVRQFIENQRKLPLYLVTLPNSPASKAIFNEHSLFFITIKVESYQSSNPIQCFNC